MVDEVTKMKFLLFCLLVCKRIEGEGDQEQYENKGSLAGGGGSCIASCIVWRHNIRGGWPARHTQHRVRNHWFLLLISADKTRNCIKKGFLRIYCILNILYFRMIQIGLCHLKCKTIQSSSVATLTDHLDFWISFIWNFRFIFNGAHQQLCSSNFVWVWQC